MISKEGMQADNDTSNKTDLFLFLYQMTHNELLVRIQQRDQYYICIIGTFIALSVGLFGIENLPPSPLLIGLCFIGIILMIFLTFLLWNSCSIYEELIVYLKNLEQFISSNNTGILDNDLQLWQHRIDKVNPNHRIKSFLYAKTIFFILNLIIIFAFIYILHN